MIKSKIKNENANNTEINCISLCSGYEGIGLGLKRIIPNLRTIIYSEIEKYACEVLVKRMEEGKIDIAPIWSDLKTFPSKHFLGKVDIITGGYPCQPFSAAGKRKGTEDPRHLWPYIAKIIRDCVPKWVFFENVQGHLSLGIAEVLSDLEAMGYVSESGLFSAAEVGAPHQRKRVFILAYAKDKHARLPIRKEKGKSKFRERLFPARPGEKQYEWEEPRTI
jgi:DNA (cytosine-5)-methyltransferase 1